jgi:hypothetical protein
MAEQNKWVDITAGSEYGAMTCWYEVVEGVLVLRDQEEDSALAGNSIAADFEGMTIDQARQKCDVLNDEPTGHAYDGCHVCKWSIGLDEEDGPPSWIAYEEPSEVHELRELIRAFLGKRASFRDLKSAIEIQTEDRGVRQSSRRAWTEELVVLNGGIHYRPFGPFGKAHFLARDKIGYQELLARLKYLAYELDWS